MITHASPRLQPIRRMLSLNLKRNMATTPKVVLLACGSFNPLTNMHLRLFELARDALNRTERYQVIEGIISPVSDHYKKKDLAPAKERCNMVQLALDNSSNWIRLDRWESEQPQWLETERVLSHHKETLDNKYNANVKPSSTKRRKKSKTKEGVADEVDNSVPRIIEEDEQPPLLKLLCGADLLESFGTPGLWKDEDIETIVGKYGLVCVTRAGFNPESFIYESDVLTKYKENIILITEWMTNDISSTKIRRALRRGESVKYLIPDPVIDYIRDQRLYGVPDNKYINHLMPSPVTPMMDITPEPEEDMTSSSSGEISVILRSATDSSSSYSIDDTTAMLSLGHQSPVHLSSNSRNVACMTDIGSLVRRVKNYNRRILQSFKGTG